MANNNSNQVAQSPKKFLFVSLESLSGDLAWQLTKEGHAVKAYIKAKSDADVYNGFIEKVDNWESYKDWADIIVFDDVEFGEIADKLRKNGKLIIGGSAYTDKLEMDREFGQMEMRRHGINILPQWQFSNYDQAIEFIKNNPDRYVFKPSGNVPSGGKGLSFAGEEEDGKDLLILLEQNKNVWQKKAPVFQLQKYASGVEVATGAFFNGKDFIMPINVNFEHKRIFPGDIGPFAGEMGCYDEKTELLTKNGWKYFKELTYQDLIATLNPKNNQLEYHKPEKIVVYSNHRQMVQIKNRSLDILVTPDHNMWVKNRYKKEWQFIKAKDILSCGGPLKIARTADWQGGKYDIRKARFLGIYMAEGSVAKSPSRSGYQIFIAGSNPKKEKKIEEILKQSNLNWRRAKDGWYIYEKKLHQELKIYGKSYEKFVPLVIKEAAPEIITAFLDAYALGDATIMRGGWRIFYTSSQKLADDIQELLLKIGRVGLIKERNRFGRKIWIEDHYTEQKNRAFEVIERVRKIYSYLDKRDTKIVDYKGKVYCATVSSHIMYVRRNGKPFWCGNTLMFWSKPNTLFKMTLEKMKPALAESGYIGYIDINCIVNGKGIYPLEFTCFSDDTEILTEKGWKLINNVKVNEVVATLNPNSHYLEYQKTTGKIAKRYQGEMISIAGAGKIHEAIDCLATPDHQMYIQKRNGKFDFVRADSIPQGSKIKRGCQWLGKALKTYTVQGYTEKHYLGRYHKIHPIEHQAVTMSMDIWLKFLGIFLAEGSIGGRRHLITISQLTKRKLVENLLKDFPFRVTKTKNGFQISSTQLVKHLLSYNFGRCNTKYIPDYVKALPAKQIKVFLDAFRVGDGNIHKRTKQVSYFSTSKRLIDDIQELLLKCGYAANIRRVKSKSSRCAGTKYFRNHDIYFISERRNKIDYYVDKRNIKKVPYNGKVYCVEVPNHIVYARRNGKAFWAGNCRFGYPTIPIQLEGILTPTGEWLSKMAKGETFELKTKRGFQVGVRILVPTYLTKNDKEIVEMYRDVPILFKKPGNLEGVHIEDIKSEEGVWRVAGESGCLLVITGSGSTVTEARAQAYSRVKNIMVQNMFYRTDIGHKWSSDSDKLQTWGYLY